jgi:hypothetical protein
LKAEEEDQRKKKRENLDVVDFLKSRLMLTSSSSKSNLGG